MHREGQRNFKSAIGLAVIVQKDGLKRFHVKHQHRPAAQSVPAAHAPAGQPSTEMKG
jgi:hypothetical protein